MDSTAQNNSSPANIGQQQTSDDSIANLQAQLSNLQNSVAADEKKQAEEFKKKEEEKKLTQTSQNPTSRPLSKTQTQQPVQNNQLQQQAQDDQIEDLANIKDKANKERKDQLVGSPSPERAPVREVQAEFEPPQELEQWMEKKPDPEELTLPEPIEDEFGDIIIEASKVPKPNIVLPMDEEEIRKGLHYKVVDSVRWLAEWCKRNIFVYPKRVFYKKKNKDNKK